MIEVAGGILLALGVVAIVVFLFALLVRTVFIYQVSGFGFIGWLMRLIGRDR